MRYHTQHLALPFFEDAHRRLVAELSDWAAAQQIDETHVDQACRHWVQALGAAGWLRGARTILASSLGHGGSFSRRILHGVFTECPSRSIFGARLRH